MKRQLATILGTIVLSIASGSAGAADVDTAPAAYDWSGPYVGLQGGGSWGDVDHLMPDFVNPFFDGEVSGLVLGAYAGYNYQMNDSFVFGFELGGNWRDVDGSTTTVSPEVFETRQKWDASAVARLGIPMDNFMFYGLGGLSVTEIFGDYHAPVDIFPGADDTVFGWTAGAGLEAAVTENVHARLEYRYADYGKADLTCSGCGPTDIDLSDHTVMLGISYDW